MAIRSPGREITVVRPTNPRPLTSPPPIATGSLSLVLLPSTYDIAVDFQGVNVGTATANLTSDQSVTCRPRSTRSHFR